jgi:hypothetical protein
MLMQPLENVMKTKVAAVAVALASCGAVALANGSAESPFSFQHFSATMEASSGGHTVSNGKVYRSGEKMRTDMAANGYTLYLLDKHTYYMVMRGHCMQMPSMPGKTANPFQASGTVTRKPIGSATVDGHPAKIEQVTVISADGKSTTMKVWEATDLQGFPVRIEIGSNTRMDYKDVSLKDPPASLFEKPANCMRMPMMPGGMS